MQSPKKRQSLGGGTIPGPSSAQTRQSFVDKGRWAKTKGTKPVQDPTSVGEIFTKVAIHFCRKVLFIEAKYRLTAYAILLFFASLVADYMPFPKTYFAYSDNFLNQYFVKFSWFWTFTLTGTYMYLTTMVYCCGNYQHIWRHFSRLAIATIVWFLWTNLFSMIETSTGQCLTKDAALFSVKNRRSCISKGGKWTSFDISGHAFLLMWCIFFITEEARSIVGWDGIKDYILHEEHNRRAAQYGGASAETFEETPLKNLEIYELEDLKKLYTKHNVTAKIFLVLLTILTILWDIMIAATAIYFHVMIEKVIAGLIAAFMWYILYRGFYTMEMSPGLPGAGLFKYTDAKPSIASLSASSPMTSKPTSSFGNVSKSVANKTGKPKELPDDLPKFMGMPLYALRKRKDELEMEDLDAPLK